KIAYMAPEQLHAGPIDRRADIFAAGVLLWETLTMRPLFGAENESITLTNVLEKRVEPPSTVVPGLPPALDDVTLRALRGDPAERFATARQMASALSAAVPVAPAPQVAEWVESIALDILNQRAQQLARIESAPQQRSWLEGGAGGRIGVGPTVVGTGTISA